MRFSLAAIMFVVTAASLTLALVRAIPLPEEFRQALLVFSLVWGTIGLLAAGPAWLRFLDLRRRAGQRDAALREWVKNKQRELRDDG